MTDSAERARESRYQCGLKQMEAGEYEQAKTVFALIADYRDAADQGKECDYRIAAGLLDAGKPEEYVNFFAWGETAPKEDYSQSTYKFGWSSSDPLFKYNANSFYGPADNKTVLDPEDDVASVKLGGKWRIPTDAEWTELLEQCTWAWTSNYSESGVSGTIITAPNGNSIFLPAAGEQLDTYIQGADAVGYYWSSSLDTNSWQYVWCFSFSYDDVRRNNLYRFWGRSVRPVTD